MFIVSCLTTKWKIQSENKFSNYRKEGGMSLPLEKHGKFSTDANI